jgi:threonine/homoserine efflux transporter RhtA
MSSAEDEDRRMRILAIALMCGTMVCFTGQDTCAKWLSASLPIAQIVWARYVGASLIALIASGPFSRPAILRSKRPRLQLLRSALLFVSTTANVFAVRQLQLSETATISFLTPVFVALLAGPVLGETVSAERMIAIALGFLGVVIATRPGTGAYQPIVLVAIVGVVCNSGYVLATRKLAGADAPQTTLVWTQIAGIVFLTPNAAVGLAAASVSTRLANYGGNGRFRGHEPRNADRRASIRARADVDAIYLHSAHLDDRLWRRGVWTVANPRHFGRSGACCRVRRLSRCQRAQRTEYCDRRNG